ncbi:MAG: polysulfide reductase NrfD [Bacteroidetes Order II. Incertae sedis bacterium]|nr:polysulfide reductase NrfD [Bacteroidetes Order II. bacterium]
MSNLATHTSYDPPLVDGNPSFHDITEWVSVHNERKAKPYWWAGFSIAAMLTIMLVTCFLYLFWNGIGVWGNNNPVGWAWDIVNFVFWVGIGHAGTLISAVLFLFRQEWRTAINRSAEAMTIFAVICALIFPAFHIGRQWMAYYLFPIPGQMGMWPNFRSPLLWDVFAVGTYFTTSLIFWYTGLIPDIATLRDRAKLGSLRQKTMAFLSLGWSGSMKNWLHYEKAYTIFAALSTPLVLSVHSVVSFDFAVSQLPGWHTTIFPPYFVAGAIFSGFAMVATLLVPLRKLYNLENIITIRHIEKMNIIILVTGSMVGFAYMMEFFMAWYSGVQYEIYAFVNRAFGQYWWAYWTMFTCNVVTPQLFWFKKLRTSMTATFVLSIFVNIGMWFERFVITVTSLHRDFLPSSWDYYSPTIIDILTFIGSFGLFFFLFFIFMRHLPVIAVAEVKMILPQSDPHFYEDHAGDGHHSHEPTPTVKPSHS